MYIKKARKGELNDNAERGNVRLNRIEILIFHHSMK